MHQSLVLSEILQIKMVVRLMPLIFLVSTDEKSRDGDEIESISSIKYYAPRIYSSQYRAVTASDYESVLGYIYPNVESVTLWW